jgi:hypothetical protein
MEKIKETDLDIEKLLMNSLRAANALGRFLYQIDNGIRQWVMNNQESIRKFIILADNIKESLDYAEKARKKMIEAGFVAGDYSFSFLDIMELGQYSQEEYENAVYTKSIEEKAEKDLLELMQKRPILSKRCMLVQQAIELHRKREFAGAVVLTLSQIEGLFNDLLIEKGYAEINENGEIMANKSVLLGIKKKLEHMKKMEKGKEEIVDVLISNAFIENQTPEGFNNFRNSILHGSNIEFANMGVSTKVILWLYAVVYNYCLFGKTEITKSA